MASVLAVFGETRDLPIGSHKSNIGHTMTASGMAGLLKLLCALEQGRLPASIGVREPMSELASTPLRLIEETEPWSTEGPRRAALYLLQPRN